MTRSCRRATSSDSSAEATGHDRWCSRSPSGRPSPRCEADGPCRRRVARPRGIARCGGPRSHSGPGRPAIELIDWVRLWICRCGGRRPARRNRPRQSPPCGPPGHGSDARTAGPTRSWSARPAPRRPHRPSGRDRPPDGPVPSSGLPDRGQPTSPAPTAGPAPPPARGPPDNRRPPRTIAGPGARLAGPRASGTWAKPADSRGSSRSVLCSMRLSRPKRTNSAPDSPLICWRTRLVSGKAVSATVATTRRRLSSSSCLAWTLPQ